MRSRGISPAALPALAALALTMGLSACHKTPPAPQGAAAAGVKPGQVLPAGVKAENLACTLLTRDDAETQLGGAVQAPITSLTADIGQVSSRCAYISVDTHPVKVLTLLATRWEKAPDATMGYERAHVMAQTISGQLPETIEGLGQRAYWVGGTLNRLNVLSGNTWLVITANLGPGVDQQAPAKAAAAAILRHL